jgi:hypothetical protein
MGLRTGLDGQLGMKAESTVGTAVTVDRFYEFESFDPGVEVVSIRSEAIGLSQFHQQGRHREFVGGGTAQFRIPLRTKKAGLILSHCLGSYANAAVAGSEYKGTITFDANGLVGLGLTLQVGIPDVGGTVRPYTMAGFKVASWTISCALDGELMLEVEGPYQTIVTATALATASYTASMGMYTHDMLGITLAGAAIFVTDISIKGENPLVVRRKAGNTHREQLVAGRRTVTGSLAFEFESLTRFGQLIAGTEVANLIFTWTSPDTIAGGGPHKIVATAPYIQFTGAPPSLDGPDIVGEPMEWIALYDGTNSPLRLEYHSTDTAA